jgi:flagellar basal-body rod protein FlgF
LGDISIGRAGVITVQSPQNSDARDGKLRAPTQTDRIVLRMETVAPNAALQHVGAGMFLPDASRTAAAVADRSLMQGALEASNVNAIDAMTDMIDTVRAYADVQKSMLVLDDIRGIAANQIGKPT